MRYNLSIHAQLQRKAVTQGDKEASAIPLGVTQRFRNDNYAAGFFFPFGLAWFGLVWPSPTRLSHLLRERGVGMGVVRGGARGLPLEK